MRSIPTGILAELAKTSWTEFTGVSLTINSTEYLYTDADTPVVVGSDRYEPRKFTFQTISYSKANIVSRASLRMENVDEIFTSLFVGSVVQGSEVAIKKIVLPDEKVIRVTEGGDIRITEDGKIRITESYLTPVAVTTFEGTIDDWNLDESVVDIAIASALQRWSQKTLSNYAPSCRWKVFKGTECGYSGSATTCDRSYQRCVDLGNQANFGGFRWLPSIQDKPIWWGKKPAI